MKNNSGHLCRLVSLALMAVLLNACAARKYEPIQLDMSYTPGAALKPGLAPVRDCVVMIDRIVDERTNKKSFGYVEVSEKTWPNPDPTFHIAIQGKNAEDWVRRIFNDLRVLGYTVLEDDSARMPAVRMSAHLTQINVRFVNTSMTSTVRMTVRYTKKDGVATVSNYRGGYTKVNWIAAPGEIMAALNHAVIGAMHDVARDLTKQCES